MDEADVTSLFSSNGDSEYNPDSSGDSYSEVSDSSTVLMITPKKM